MPTANETLADLAVSHQIYLQRYGGGVVRRFMQLLNRVDDDLFARLTEALERLPPESFTVQRLDQMLVQVRGLNAEAYRAAGEELDGALLDLAGYEASYQHRVLQSVLPAKVADALVLSTVSPNQVYAAAMARPFQGKLLKEALKDIETAKAIRIRDAIRMGFVEGETIGQMVRRLRGTRALKYADGLMEIDRRGAEALVRTAVNHTANYARQAVYEANADIVKEVQWLSTLDGRTTVGCAALSGRTFPVGSGPRPPRHWGCRSTTVPVLTSAWEALGLSKSEIEPSTQASMDGQVAGDINYGQWLKGKPAAFQDEVLGAERGKLFRSGGITVDRFADSRGREYTLDELRKRDAAAFERAGL
ncbi:minor capsid protein [Stutzerimonas stutzeri]|uniref:minor capsid protein n=1 Tax=Stutzerimonas stutzeri TaxID=316 RepID=UPI00244AF3F4|nr:minor capsid protein [Stutzerimonas stutzeri]MDH0157348.1 phage head morphogenesis protein [Stutzerimonas stutzeri]